MFHEEKNLKAKENTRFFFILSKLELVLFIPSLADVIPNFDLREDKEYLSDRPGATPISTTQGEELKKLIGAVAYVECSSKTQQVTNLT
ncbi:unnamed protein product [Coffea canephora]|uniref:Uncharacterized protein n=1 Tax=Coffea canephora TaxID=49390 RepID=A0A068TLU7_COFCA|nr:unnamed protein product [Coffea canephora]